MWLILCTRFGGTNGVEWFNDVWSYDPRTNQWTQLDCIGFIPPPREGHAAALVNDVMYVFGGRSSEGNDLGDLAAFRISSRRWYTFQNMGPSPSPRSGHTMSTVGTKIVVLGGEPSVPTRSQEELQLVYVLETAKIRYPNDSPAQASPTGARAQPKSLPNARNGSVDSNSSGPGGAAVKRPPRESVVTSPPPAGTAPSMGNNAPSGPAVGSRLPRASVAGQPAGPPPTQQPPPPRTGQLPGPGPRSGSALRGKENVSPVGPLLPGPNGRGTPTMQRKDSKEGGAAAERSTPHHPQQQISAESLNSASSDGLDKSVPSSAVARPQPLNSQPREAPQRSPVDIRGSADQPSFDQPTSPVRPQPSSSSTSTDTVRSPANQRVYSEEIEKLQRTNDWYASELALARRAGYTPQTSNSSLLEDRGNNPLPEDERPFVEAMLALKGQLAKVQNEVDLQSTQAAKRIQEVERQRDIAVQEAVYAKAKLAAVSGPATPTPGDKGSDTASMDAEKMTDMGRKLAASLSAQAELSAKVEVLKQEIGAERKARHLADETASTAQSRISELDEYRNWAASEIETLRAELLDAGKAYRDAATRGEEADAELKLLQIDHTEMTTTLEETIAENGTYQASLEQLNKAMQLTNQKSTTLERQLEEERVVKESLERKLAQLRSEYEEKTADLQSVNQRLKDMEELMETYQEEARAANAVLAVGLDRVTVKEPSSAVSSAASSAAEDRLRVLQDQIRNTQSILAGSKAQADETGEKLAEAMQRVAGLEFQQGQSSKDSIALRRRMAEVGDEARRLKQENAELSNRINDKQLEVDAVTAKHNALKDILSERSPQAGLDKNRSPVLSPSPGSGTVTPEQLNRLRDLEARLEESLRAHRETKTSAEMQAQEVEKHFREKLEQLENDYQSAVHYVKGTEKMLKRMKEELGKYKTQNARLQMDLEEVQRASGERSQARSENEADWEQERELLNKEIEDLRARVRESATALDKQIRETKEQLDHLRNDRDQFKAQHNQLQLQLLDNSQEINEAKSLVEKLENENALLEDRAQSAEQKVSMLLDQVENSVDAYRRSTRLENANGELASARSSYYSGPDNRTSVALDSLATELDALRNHWESTNKTYRLSNAFDFEKPLSSPHNNDFSSNIAQWRQKLAQEEQSGGRSSSSQDAHTPMSPVKPTDSRNGVHSPSTPTAATMAAGGGVI
jgi:DNA repair exonuclease SbcCD ATPase subunit